MGFFDFLFEKEDNIDQMYTDAMQMHREEEEKNIPILERRRENLVNRGLKIEKKIDSIATKEAENIISGGEVDTLKLKIHPSVKKLIHEYEKIKTPDHRWNDRKKKLWLEMLKNYEILPDYEIIDTEQSHYHNSFYVSLLNSRKNIEDCRAGYPKISIEPKLKDWELIYVQKINDQANVIIHEFRVKEQKEELAKAEFRDTYLDSRKQIEKSIAKIDRSELCLIKTPFPNLIIRDTFDRRWGKFKKDEWKISKAQNKLYEKWDKERNKFIKNKLFEEGKKDLFINEPVNPTSRTGDDIRFNDFNREINKENRTDKYLYLVKIKSRIDDKNYIKIGLTSKGNVEGRFDLDDVVDLIEIYRLVKLDSRLAMSIEYNLIRKYRPKGYIAEKEFDQFSRFSGYTEIIPMRRTSDVCQDIDYIVDSLDLKEVGQGKTLLTKDGGFDDDIPF